jgi:hypothetical protein
MRLLARHPLLDAATAAGALTISWARRSPGWTGRIDHEELQAEADQILVDRYLLLDTTGPAPTPGSTSPSPCPASCALIRFCFRAANPRLPSLTSGNDRRAARGPGQQAHSAEV